MARTYSLLKIGLQVAVLGGLVVAALNYQAIWDQYALATYTPATDIAKIEPTLALTKQGKAIFYRASPVISGKAQFNKDCQTSGGLLELGCYYRSNIYILRIDDARLAPEMQVVAAHELLHAAWLRLSSGERNRLAVELNRVYATIDDADLRERMASYERTEPGEQANELHSILATEYLQLSPELEEHYRRYFSDRARVVAAHDAYRQVFETRRKELEAELAQIRALKAQLAVLNRQLEAYRTSNRIEQYNALVPQQNKLVDNINSRIDAYQSGVDEYNALSLSLDSQEIKDTETNIQ
jgi:hypothetical protein